MISELEIVSPAIVAGRKIRVTEYNVRNYRLHQVLEQLARLFLFLLECDSNNTNSKVKPRDVRAIRSQWTIAQDELAFSMAHNDLPSGSYEQAYKLLVVDPLEIQRVRNVKVKRVLSEMFATVKVCLGVDSASTQGFIAQNDYEDIVDLFRCVDDCLNRWIGAGSDALDTGIVVPAYECVGEVSPDVDIDYASTMEPSPDSPLPPLPDVPDTAVAKK
jgi:hypothetical protein